LISRTVRVTRSIVAAFEALPGAARSPLTDSERFDLVLGITCHAVDHTGQIQLIKKLEV
jgi:hypothetical protein